MTAGLFLLVVCYMATVAASGEYDVTILTDPSQGPFRAGGQRVQFTCLVEPTPPGPVTYQWRTVEHERGGSSYTQQSFNRSYSIYDYTPYYCYYYCEVSVNETLVGSASRIVEIHGFLYPEGPVVQSFTRGRNLVLNVNMSDSYYTRFVNSITWYHNGTEIVSGNKYSISNNGTMLRITNMAESDAGSYQAKIGSISYDSDLNSSPDCDSLVLPLLESAALHAPVTFTVQEQCVPTYDPASISSTIYVTENTSAEIELRAQFNSSLAITYAYHVWYRNGIPIADGVMYNSTASSEEGLSLQIMYNNTADVAGDYVGILWTYNGGINDLSSLCRGYYYYTDAIIFIFPLKISFWNIKVTSPPSSVSLHFASPILRGLETTTVECTAVGGGPVETFNLTLWRNEELLAAGNGRSLSHFTTPPQYGTYRCSVDRLHSTAVLKEKALFQLLLDNAAPSTLCQQSALVDNMKTAVGDLLGQLCQSCDSVSPRDIVDVQLNCTTSGRLYLTAGLVYSAPDGRITASTLLHSLTVWLLAQDSPSIVVNGTPVSLNQQCLTLLNEVTRNGCIALITSADTTDAISATISPQYMTRNGCIVLITSADTTDAISATISPQYNTQHLVVGFFAGVVAGVLIATAIVALIICVMRLRAAHSNTVPPPESREAGGKSADIPMDTNQAYESVSVRYQAGRMQEAQADEGIYDIPAAV